MQETRNERGRRNKRRSSPARREHLRQKDCIPTKLWKAKAPKAQPARKAVNLSGLCTESGMGFLLLPNRLTLFFVHGKRVGCKNQGELP